MSRRLMKGLEDLFCNYDGTVRQTSKRIVQLIYGEDGLDPTLMEGQNGTCIDSTRMLMTAKSLEFIKYCDYTFLKNQKLERKKSSLPSVILGWIKSACKILSCHDGLIASLKTDCENSLFQKFNIYMDARHRLGLPLSSLGE